MLDPSPESQWRIGVAVAQQPQIYRVGHHSAIQIHISACGWTAYSGGRPSCEHLPVARCGTAQQQQAPYSRHHSGKPNYLVETSMERKLARRVHENSQPLLASTSKTQNESIQKSESKATSETMTFLCKRVKPGVSDQYNFLSPLFPRQWSQDPESSI